VLYMGHSFLLIICDIGEVIRASICINPKAKSKLMVIKNLFLVQLAKPIWHNLFCHLAIGYSNHTQMAPWPLIHYTLCMYVGRAHVFDINVQCPWGFRTSIVIAFSALMKFVYAFCTKYDDK
jgi:hypothetical protein